YKSEATGLANLAGRSAAAMALAARIWKEHLNDTIFADKCLNAARTLYQLGKEKEGFQQGNSYGAPYRYTEETWTDDMEWGAAELYKATGKKSYLEEAKHYARMANTVSWMNLDSAAHYQYYPFINLGHFSLYELVEKDFQDTLAAYYQNGIDYTFKKAQNNHYGIGIPFIWCSNNLLTSLITQVILYEKMTSDTSYHQFMVEQRDWLFGRNPWGTSMFTGIPANGEYPLDIHTSIWALTKQEVPGGLVDGPVFSSIYKSLKGLSLLNPDEFAEVQNNYVVYHDDIGDYSTNEPTMDGTAGAIIMMAYWGADSNSLY
ncbi:MAG: glycoside hydrolase family 9 protein, partial [Bacteroidales bacterium]|nr:glycoside hydrolase family 9 protein [Bacteroidales bacterium]